MVGSKINFQHIFERGLYSGLLQLSDGRMLTDHSCSFDIHKVILASCSGYFRTMFCGMDKDKREYRISNVKSVLVKFYATFYINDICMT